MRISTRLGATCRGFRLVGAVVLAGSLGCGLGTATAAATAPVEGATAVAKRSSPFLTPAQLPQGPMFDQWDAWGEHAGLAKYKELGPLCQQNAMTAKRTRYALYLTVGAGEGSFEFGRWVAVEHIVDAADDRAAARLVGRVRADLEACTAAAGGPGRSKSFLRRVPSKTGGGVEVLRVRHGADVVQLYALGRAGSRVMVLDLHGTPEKPAGRAVETAFVSTAETALGRVAR